MKVTRDTLKEYILEALELKGPQTPNQVSKWVWNNHSSDLRKSGDLLYSWQYDLRWAIQRLKGDDLAAIDSSHKPSIWSITARGKMVRGVKVVRVHNAEWVDCEEVACVEITNE